VQRVENVFLPDFALRHCETFAAHIDSFLSNMHITNLACSLQVFSDLFGIRKRGN
jgi:hypothetical protein